MNGPHGKYVSFPVRVCLNKWMAFQQYRCFLVLEKRARIYYFNKKMDIFIKIKLSYYLWEKFISIHAYKYLTKNILLIPEKEVLSQLAVCTTFCEIFFFFSPTLVSVVLGECNLLLGYKIYSNFLTPSTTTKITQCHLLAELLQ